MPVLFCETQDLHEILYAGQLLSCELMDGAGQRTCLAKVAQNAQKPSGRHLSRPSWTFCGPLAAIFDFAGGAALQAVSECPRRRQAGIFLAFCDRQPDFLGDITGYLAYFTPQKLKLQSNVKNLLILQL